jgi:hypothetical protein
MESMYKINFILAIAIALGLISYAATTTAQQPPAEQSTSGQQGDVPLSFFLKLKDDSKNVTSSGNQSQAKNATITVTVEKGPGGDPVKLPVSAMVPAGTEAKDLELCASLKDGKEVCQPLDKKDAKIDLSQGQANQSSSNVSSTPTAYSPTNEFLGQVQSIINSMGSVQSANAQLITIDDTTLNIPITVIVPITLQIQNAQVCATVASSGDQTCNQIVMNPTQTAFTPVDIDLSTGATPTITTAASEPMQATTTDSTTSSPEGTNDTSSASTSESGGSSTSNDTGSDTEQQDGSTESNDGETNNGDSAEGGDSGDSTSGTN